MTRWAILSFGLLRAKTRYAYLTNQAVHDASAKVVTDEWSYHTTTVTCIEFSADNKAILSTGLDNKVYLWSTETLTKDCDVANIHKNGVNSVTFLQDNDNFITAGGDNLLKHYSV